MYAQVTALRYWKSEHNEDTCEDASNHDISRGIFAVADGVGTASFSNIWAKILVEEVVKKPLMSHDPFEVEWWLRTIQPLYEKGTPKIDQLPPLVQGKAREGSLSTLATLRMSHVDHVDHDSAQAQLLVFGDSCVIVANKVSQEVMSFKLNNPLDFAKPPICVPSKLRAFDRDFNRCDVDSLTLRPHHVVILATDAVAKWILSQGNGHYGTRWGAFEEVAAQTEQMWAAFIQSRRLKNDIVDDDSTALVIRFSAEANEGYEKLGTTTSYGPEVKKERQKQLDEARRAQDREKVAIFVGNQQTVGSDLPDEEVQKAREVADGLKMVRQTLRMALQRNINIPLKVTPVWQKHAHLLQNEPCAATIRNSLKQMGVTLDASPPAISPPTTKTFKDDLPQATVTRIDEYRQKQLQKKRNHSELTNPEPPFEALTRFRHALASRDFKQIVVNYDPILDDLPVVTAVERRILKASQKLESTHSQLLAALYQDDEFIITEKYRAFMAFFPEFVSSYESSQFNAPNLEPNQYLPAPHQQRLETALKQTEAYEQFQEAIEEEDDQKIVENYPSISSKHKNLISKEKKDQFQSATHRLNALRILNEALPSKNAQRIIDSYDPILDNYNKIQPEQRQKVEKARRFVQMRQQVQLAIKDNDNIAILNTYDEPLAGEFSDFTPAETARIEEAKQKQREELLLSKDQILEVLNV